MNFEQIKALLERSPNIYTALGMELLPMVSENVFKLKIKVDERTKQPYGFLSGGASLALAETLAGIGSAVLCPDALCVGVNISGSHLKSVPEGEEVIATAELLHKGKALHQWLVSLRNAEDELVSTVQVTNYVKKDDLK